MNEVDLARWQGMIDERTARSVERLDVINGDVREIKLALVGIGDELAASAVSRAEWEPILKKLSTSDAVATAVAEKLQKQKALGLTYWQKWIGVAGVFAALSTLALRLAGFDGFA